MPTKDEQFSNWYENATRDELLDAAKQEIVDVIEEEFKDSREYTEAMQEYAMKQLEEYCDIDYFEESKWFNPDEQDKTENE